MTKRTNTTLRLSLCWALALALMLIGSQAAMGEAAPFNPPADQNGPIAKHGHPFFLIKKDVNLEEGPLEVPVPDYEDVDVAGDFKNAPGSVACVGAGGISEGVAEDADDCLLRPQMTFTDGYLDAAGTVVTPNATSYNGLHGQLEITGHVGDVVQFTSKNTMPEAVNGTAISTGFYAPADNVQIIHWHGMELDNESDGTPVTEWGIEPGEQRLYQYRLYRPGNYWFHPHVLPLLTESRGQVGKLVVRSYEEDILTLLGVLPLKKIYVQLHDSTVANDTNKFLLRNGILFQHFTDFEADNNLMPDISPDLNNDGMCDRGAQAADCIVNEGELVFANGVVPTGDHDVPTIEVKEGGGARVAFVNSSNERFYRFRLLLDGEEPPFAAAERSGRGNTGECYDPVIGTKFSGSDPLSCDQGLVMYRIGGQNGLLDNVRVEGQPEIPHANPFVPRPYDTIIRTGEDFIGPSERTEFVVVTKDRNGDYLEAGDQMFVWSIDYPHGRFTPFFDNTIGNGDSNNRDINARKLVRIKIVPRNFGHHEYDLAENDPLMTHPLINRPNENLKGLTTTELDAVPIANDNFLDPPAPFAGTEDEAIVLGNRVVNGTRFPSLNGERGFYVGDEWSGTDVPTQESTRYARIGDVVEFIYANNTGNAHHPFHMHGFSFQLISIHEFENVDTNMDGTDDSVTLDPAFFTYPYNEFVDVEAMQPSHAVKYRMKMNDRYKIPDETKFSWFELLAKFPYDYTENFGGEGDMAGHTSAEMGGGLGRWLFHCHILHHAGLGMIGDLCVAPTGDPDARACKIFVDPDIYEEF